MIAADGQENAVSTAGGVPPSGGGDKRGQGTDGSLSPLDTPDPPLSCSAKHSRLNGGYGGSVPCVVSLMG